ncbi:hypothetical protein CA13_43630 [Planctomycetes bacterium CA13]|uniref:HEAT repeat domain-containing protein n=1 Tax=Novipirellula herctigrandis TaxID=2527986 RepID=A0A5C5Z6T3_9BACT|nr:hypothetical protein CA13_43630 [Planctomycetes bacterium CA13]
MFRGFQRIDTRFCCCAAIRVVVFALGCSATSSLILADTIELRGGGHVSGKVRRLVERKIDIVEVDDEISIAFPGSQVDRAVSSKTLAEYRDRVAKAGEDAQEHYLLAVWCAKTISANKDAYRRFHMQMAVRFDPDHSKARASLGYVQTDDGKWIRYTDLMRSRGMISVGGKWVLPEAAAISEYHDSSNVDAKHWVREIERLLKVVIRNNSKSAEAMATLQAIDDPLAASAIAKQLLENNHGRPLDLLWVELLSRFQNLVSVEALTRAGLFESDDVVREAALTKLQDYGSDSAVLSYVGMLRSNDHADVTRAARALRFFPDVELASVYIDALVTTHTKTIAPKAGLTPGFSDNGSSSFSTGGKPVKIKRNVENPGMLALLKTVEPDVDFGYDKQAWRRYFALKHGGYSGDLRRDP